MNQYKFLDFSLNTQKHTLFKSGKNLEIGKTAFNILLFFLQRPGQVIKREELFAQVWPDTIVTDATIYKQVQRLRKVLSDTAEDKTIIITVHGVGFKFLPEVSCYPITDEVINQGKSKSKSKFKSKLLIFSALILLSYFIVSLIFNKVALKEDDVLEMSIISEVIAQPITVAMIPSFSGTDDTKQQWMANGGVHYLAETFDKAQVNIKRYSKKQLNQTDPDQFALELSIKNSVDASVIFDVVEKDRQFISDVKLRNIDGIISEKKFTAVTVVNLLDDISLWSKKILKLEPTSTSQVMSDNRYAAENYIRGMSAQLSGDAKTAIKYFELATQEDDGFWLAWYELSISYRKQGNNEKALSIINSLDNKTIEKRHKMMLMASKGNIFYRSGEYENALAEFNRGIVLARELKDYRALSSFLTNKTFVLSSLGNFELAMNSITESIDIINVRPGDKSASLGAAYNTLSGLHIKLNQFDQASKYSLLAIEKFQLAGDLRYETSAQSRYAGILYDTGYIKKAQLLNDELLIVRQSLEDIPGQVSSFLRLIPIHLLLGEFNQTENYIEQAADLLNVTGNNYQLFPLLVNKAKLKLLKGELPLAKDIISKLQDKNYDSSQLFQVKTLWVKYHQLQSNHEQWKKLVTELYQNVIFEDEPLIYLFKAQLAIKENDKQHVEFMFEKAKTLAISQQQTITIAQVMNAYTAYLIDTNETLKAQQIIDELAEYRPQDYPYLKNKARLAYINMEYFAALTLMQQLKNTANDHWQVADMMLLEKYQKIQNPNNK